MSVDIKDEFPNKAINFSCGAFLNVALALDFANEVMILRQLLLYLYNIILNITVDFIVNYKI